MNLYSKNIFVNCLRYLTNYYAIFHYICIEIASRGAMHSSYKIPFHLPVNSGGWFFYTNGGCHKGKVYACTALITHCHGTKLFNIYYLITRKCSVAFLWFRVSESGYRYAHKNPFLAMFRDKNSTPENSH